MKRLLVYSLFFITTHSLVGMETISSLKDADENTVYKKIEKAHQKNNLLLYKTCIAKILPLDLCSKIDATCVLLKNEDIKKSFISHIIPRSQHSNYARPHLTISNNGNYYCHNISYKHGDPTYKLMRINNDTVMLKINSWNDKAIEFSPNSEYCIIKEVRGTAFYNLANQQMSEFFDKDKALQKIMISDDSHYILLEELKKGNFNRLQYTLCTVNKNQAPQITPLHLGIPELRSDQSHLIDILTGSRAAIFHPDSKHIIHSHVYDQLELYNIESSQNKIIKKPSEKDIFITKLSTTTDNKKIVANLLDTVKDRKMVFNIANLDNVTSVMLQKEPCDLPFICIPHKDLVTNILYNRFILQLVDEKAELVASHTNYSTKITTLAVNNTGDYLAVGYADGTIMIWDVSDINKYPNKKIIKKCNGSIKSLTFSDNQLLLSQSESGKFWDTREPTSTPGNATLWDVYGNEIINFGDNIVNSIMSKNGKTIITISAELKWNDIGILSSWYRYITLTTYHNKNLVDYVSNNEPTLSQLKKLIK